MEGDRPDRRLRLLIVDDDPLNQRMMEMMLSPEGHVLAYASNGAEALEAIKTGVFDLVFLDLVLPDMNGRDVARQVRIWEGGNSHVPIVAVTAYDLPGQPLELVKAGMDDYLFKPFSARGLNRMIKLYAEDARQASASPTASSAASASNAPVLDYAGSLVDFSDDRAGYEALLKDFIASLHGRMRSLREALRMSDFERLGREAHSLKGISAGLGALQLSGLATQLGRCAAAARQEACGETLEQMAQAVEDLERQARLKLGT